MYSGMFEGLQMSDEPTGLPSEEELLGQALIHGDEHLKHEQPTGNGKDEFFSQDFANGVPDRFNEQEQQQPYQELYQQQEMQQEAQDADFWFIPNAPPDQLVPVLAGKLMQVRDYLEGDVFQQEAQQYRQQRLQEIDQELQDFSIAYKALQSNPKDFLVQYLPEVLMEYGISPVMTQAEIGQRVQDNLKQMYGEDYQQRVDPAEMFTPGSYTSMVYQSQQQLFQQYANQNAQNEEIVKNWGQMVANGQINSNPQQSTFDQMPVETQAQQLVQEYEQNWKQHGYTEDEFAQFVEDAKSSSMGMQDVHKVVYFNNYLSEAYRQGVEEGRQMMYNRIRTTGNGNTIQRFQQQQSSPVINYDEQQKANLFKQLAEGGIPMW